MRAPAPHLRTTLQQNRFGELREGVWLRPGQPEARPAGTRCCRGCGCCTATTTTPAELAAQLWDLPGWAAHRQATARRHGRRRRRSGPVRRGRGDGAPPADRSRCCPTSCCPTTGPVPRCAQSYARIRRRTGGQTKRIRTDGGDNECASRAQRPGHHGDHEPARGAQRRQRPDGGRAVRRLRRVRPRRLGIGRGAVGRQRNLLRRSRSQGVRHARRQPGAPDAGPGRWGRRGWCCPSR